MIGTYPANPVDAVNRAADLDVKWTLRLLVLVMIDKQKVRNICSILHFSFLSQLLYLGDTASLSKCRIPALECDYQPFEIMWYSKHIKLEKAVGDILI